MTSHSDRDFVTRDSGTGTTRSKRNGKGKCSPTPALPDAWKPKR